LNKLAIAVQGVGLIGKRHCDYIAACPDTVLSAVIDPLPAARAVAGKFDVPLFASFQDMLAVHRPDGLIVATPNGLHVENGLAAVAAGIPVLVEKPLADDVASGLSLVEAAERAGVALLVGHHRRHNPMIQTAKAMVDSGRLGEIVAVHGSFWLSKPDGYYDVAWRREAGAGPVLINLIHDVDLLRYLCGEVEAVQSMSSNKQRGFAVEDTATVLLRFANGALGTVTVSDTIPAPWSWEMTTGENPAYPQSDQSCYVIGGSLGSLSIPRLEFWSHQGGRNWWKPLHSERKTLIAQDPLQLQISHFAQVIRGEVSALVSGREGLKTLQVIEAIKQASVSGKTVYLADCVDQ